MNNTKQHNKVVPDLRFPEFEKKDEWEIKSLSSIAENLSNKRIPITSNVREKGEIPYYGATGVIDYVKDYIFNENLLLISEDGANLIDRNYPIAFSICGKTWVNNHAHVLKPINEHTQTLVEKYINSISIEDYLTGQAQPKLNKENLNKIPIPLPKNQKEQQKIANCLSSLDTVITAETEKLDHLKDHKKGLLQQLFPANGETVPQFRFREFVGDGDWEEKRIEKACERPFSGGTPSSTNSGYYGGIIPFIRSAEINKEKTELFLTQQGLENSSAKIVKEGDVLVALYGANSGDVGVSKINGAINQAILCLRSKGNNSFLYQYLIHKKEWIIKKYLQGGQGNLSGDIIKSVELFFPSSKEQEKIASCFSSLDDLITIQTNKIEALKAHKKGLMQQLFPNVNDVAV